MSVSFTDYYFLSVYKLNYSKSMHILLLKFFHSILEFHVLYNKVVSLKYQDIFRLFFGKVNEEW